MKKQFCSILSLLLIAGISGCGDNKTKQKLIGTNVLDGTATTVTATPLPSSSNPTATSVSVLYATAFYGTGAGGFSLSPRMRISSPRMTPSADMGDGMGTLNTTTGQYESTDATGASIKISFLDASSNILVLAPTKIINTTGQLLTYASQSLLSTTIALTLDSTSAGLATLQTLIAYWAAGGGSRYIPSAWLYANGTPLAWYELKSADVDTTNTTTIATSVAAFSAKFQTFLLSNFPKTMVTNVSGSLPASGVTSMDINIRSDMPTTRPTAASPAHMTGTGTITLTSGNSLDITAVDLYVSDAGPIRGTQTFSCTATGETGTLTFASDGSMSGTIMKNGQQVGSISISANGSGTYTDLSVTPNQPYTISNAKPQ